MIKGKAEIAINQTQQNVFDFIVRDFTSNYRRWSPEVLQLEMLTEGPIRVGSQARQIRMDQGRKSDTTFRVVSLQDPSVVTFAESSNQFQSSYQLRTFDDQTVLTFSFELIRLEFYMRPFEKLIRVAIQDGADRVARNIKMLIESDTA